MRKFSIVLISLVLFGCNHIKPSSFNVWVDQKLLEDKTHFHSIESAIRSAPNVPDRPFKIFVAPGNYYEKIKIQKPWIHLIGSSALSTKIYYDDFAGKKNGEGNALSTPGSATVTVNAAQVRIENITIENSFDYWSNELLSPEDPKYITNAQAVALFLDVGSDKTIVRHSRVMGHQDTLFINNGRSWFDHVFIQGHVDFIFGKGNALFTDSEIKNLARAKPAKLQGFVTAPSTNIKQFYGFTFMHCRFTREKNVSDDSVALGRPWHPTTQFSDGRYADPEAIGKAVFINSWMDKHITQEGWYSMKGTTKDGQKIDFKPEDSRFFEYKNRGPGALVIANRRQISQQEKKLYTIKKIFGDWNPLDEND